MKKAKHGNQGKRNHRNNGQDPAGQLRVELVQVHRRKRSLILPVLVRRALKTSVARFPRGVRVNNAYRALKTSTRTAGTSTRSQVGYR